MKGFKCSYCGGYLLRGEDLREHLEGHNSSAASFEWQDVLDCFSEVDLHSFVVLIPEVHLSHRALLAVDEDDAIDRALDADEIKLEYRSTFDAFDKPWEVIKKGP